MPAAIIGYTFSDGSAAFAGIVSSGLTKYGDVTKQGAFLSKDGGVYAMRPSASADVVFAGYQLGNSTPTAAISANGVAAFAGDVYGNKFIPSDGYDVSKIGQALSTIHDVIESVDDLQGLKNLFHLLLDNLKSDPTPPEPPEPPE